MQNDEDLPLAASARYTTGTYEGHTSVLHHYTLREWLLVFAVPV